MSVFSSTPSPEPCLVGGWLPLIDSTQTFPQRSPMFLWAACWELTGKLFPIFQPRKKRHKRLPQCGVRSVSQGALWIQTLLGSSQSHISLFIAFSVCFICSQVPLTSCFSILPMLLMNTRVANFHSVSQKTWIQVLRPHFFLLSSSCFFIPSLYRVKFDFFCKNILKYAKKKNLITWLNKYIQVCKCFMWNTSQKIPSVESVKIWSKEYSHFPQWYLSLWPFLWLALILWLWV